MAREKNAGLARAAGIILRRAATQSLGGRPISRRRFLAGLAGAAAAAGISLTAGKMAEIKLRKTALMHQITIALERHSKKQDVEHFRQLIETAKLLGEPFHAIGSENAAAKRGQLERFIVLGKTQMELMTQLHAECVKKGLTEKEADELLYKSLLELEGDDYPEYHAALDVMAFKAGLPTAPIEEYEEREIKELEMLKSKAGKLSAKAMIVEPTLESQKDGVESAERIWAQYISRRNRRISETVPKVIALLQKHYPHLPKRGVRLLYTLGQGHAGKIELRGANTETQISFAPTQHELIPDIHQKLNNNPAAKLTELERARIVLQEHLVHHLKNLKEANRTSEISELASRLAKISQKEFHQLNAETANMPLEERAKIIYKYLSERD